MLLTYFYLPFSDSKTINACEVSRSHMSEKVLEFISEIEFVASIDEKKDCLMNQGTSSDAAAVTSENPYGLWFNIDIPKGHGLKSGDRIRIIVEKF